MGTARYYPLSFESSASDRAINPRALLYVATGVAVLSGLTVFASLCARDHSLLLSAGRRVPTFVQPVAQQPVPVVSADTQPAPDSITRVTVPTVLANTPAPAVQSKPSGAISGDYDTSVARNHNEVVGLENRGTRHYIEFNLTRSKRFQRLGPLSVGVWRIDSKHRLYDVSFLADGHRIDRKHVSLDTAVSLSINQFGRPLQFVVNSLDRNRVSGYLSEPKASH
jgi:hypothetical protein